MSTWIIRSAFIIFLFGCVAGEEPVFDSTRIPIPASGIYTGVYTVEDSTTWQARLEAIKNFENLIFQNDTARLSMDRQFYRWDNLVKNGVLNPYIKATSEAGRIPVISILTLNQQPDVNGSREVKCPDNSGRRVWPCIASGQFDAKLRDIAIKLKNTSIPSIGFSLVLEPENEIRCHNRKQRDPSYQCVPVGNSFDMGSADDYKAAWRRLVQVFKAAGADNVDFIWILQATSFSDATRQPGFVTPLEMYPGNDVIDWVSADPYNTAFNGNWKSLEEIATPFVIWSTLHAPSKPLMFAEFGAAEDPAAIDEKKRGRWFLEAGAWMMTQPRIKAALYFNRSEEFSSDETFRDWRINTLAGTEDKPRYEFRQQALPYSQFGFAILMRHCYFRRTECPNNANSSDKTSLTDSL